MSVAEDAAGWLYGKVKGATVQTQTLEEGEVTSSVAQDDVTGRIQLMEQQASRSKFDKWVKRGAAIAVGAGIAYWYMKLRKEK